jgi:16S rRNA (guanine966-N2)-methyltransferase
LFSILSNQTPGSRVLDLYAGTGALGIEAISRGAASATFVDISKDALTVIEKNIAQLDLQSVAQILRWDIRSSLHCLQSVSLPFDIVFMDPPYEEELVVMTLRHLVDCKALSSGALIVAEHHVREPILEIPNILKPTDQRRQRKSLVSFFRYML